jgi:heme A synthase
MIRWPEATLFVACILVILFIFVTARRGGKPDISDKIPTPMFVGVRIALGVILAILGVIGAFLPVVQGWIFMLLAVVVLFPQSRFAIATLRKAEPKMPRFVGWLRKWGIGVRPEDQHVDVEEPR